MSTDTTDAARVRSRRKAQGILLAATVVVAGALMAVQPVRSPDVWHHAASGRLVAQTGRPATSDVFSHTACGRRWIQYEWLAQVIIYGSYALGGADGLQLLRMAAVAGAAALMLLAARARGAGPAAAAVAVALALCGMSERFFTRPEIFTWLLFSGVMLAMEMVRRRRHGFSFLPALLVVPWVNMHGAWIAGLAWLGLVCAGDTVSALMKRRHAPARRTLTFLWLALLLAFLATLANPYGWHIWEVPFALSSSPEVTARIAEWKPTTFAYWLDPRHAGACVVIISLLLAVRGPAPADWLVAGFFGVLSLTAVRHLPLALLVTAPILARQLHLIWQGAARGGRMKRLLGRPAWQQGGVALACAALVIIALGGFAFPRAGWGPARRKFPLGAARFLKENDLRGNLYNTYDFGNLLMFKRFPKNRVFIDGRVDMYGAGIVRLYEKVRNAQSGWEDELRRRAVGVCVVDVSRPTDRRLLETLHASSAWTLVFWDNVAAVYVNRSGGSPEFRRHAYTYTVRPYEPDFGLLETPSGRAAAERDYRRKLGEEEDNLVALQGLAQVLWVRGEKAESVALLEKAVAVKPDHAGLRYNLGSSLLQTGRLDAAETHLRKTLALGEYEGRACKALGVIAQKRGDTDRALGYLRRALRCNPGDWQAHWNLSVVYEQRHELGRAIGAAESVLRLRPGHAQARARVLRLKEKARERP